MSTQDRSPTGIGTYDGWVSGTGGNKWDEVDDPVGSPDEGTTYILKADGTGRESFTFLAFSIRSVHIDKLAVTARCQRTAAGACQVRLFIKVNEVFYYGTAQDATTSWADYISEWVDNPATSAPWTEADIEGTGSYPLQEIGIQALQIESGEELDCTQVYARVTYFGERLVTIKSTGGDYTSWAAAEDGEDNTGDLVTRDEIMIFELYASATDTTLVVIDGWTTDSTRYIKAICPAGERHDGKWNDSKYKLNVNQASVDALDIYENYVRLEGLQIMLTSASGDIGIIEYWVTSGAAECFVDKCIVRASFTGYNPEGIGDYNCGSNSSFKLIIRNCIAQDVQATSSYAAAFSMWVGTAYVYNCTSYHCFSAFNCGGGTAYWKNCIYSYGLYGFQGGTQTTCYSNEYAPPDPHFVSTSGTYDLHLQSDDHACKDQGTDLSSDPLGYGFSDDIDGQTRSGTWDIGADEYMVAAASLATIGAMRRAMQSLVAR